MAITQLRPVQLSMANNTLILSTARCLRRDPYGRGIARRSFSSTVGLLEEFRTGTAGTAPTAGRPALKNLDWDINPSGFKKPYEEFGYNQYIKINEDLKAELKQVLWQFNAPIMYAVAYGSGVFPQSKPQLSQPGTTSNKSSVLHTNQAVNVAQAGNPKMVDFIFGVTHVDHWHSVNLKQHRHHYSALGSLGCGAVSRVQQNFGAGVYFNPYVTMNGMLIKYGVVSLDTLRTDLSEWSTMYVAGRLQKPVKILRQTADIQVANQINLISALRTALLLLPPTFTEMELYGTIAGISYLGDPRMALPTEDPGKVANIVGNNLPHFRRLYGPLIEDLPNLNFNDVACTHPNWASDASINAKLEQDMDPIKRGNMVRRLPKNFRKKMYFQFQKKFQMPNQEFEKMMEESQDEDAQGSFKRRQGGQFEQKIATLPPAELGKEVRQVIKDVIGWPSTVQSIKGLFTSGFGRTFRYVQEKMQKHKAGKAKEMEKARLARLAVLKAAEGKATEKKE